MKTYEELFEKYHKLGLKSEMTNLVNESTIIAHKLVKISDYDIIRFNFCIEVITLLVLKTFKDLEEEK